MRPLPPERVLVREHADTLSLDVFAPPAKTSYRGQTVRQTRRSRGNQWVKKNIKITPNWLFFFYNYFYVL